jgi:hypothetical protein
MRLEHRDDAAAVQRARGGEGGADFRGMVAVVVNDFDAARHPLALEAPLDADESLQRVGRRMPALSTETSSAIRSACDAKP